ncbi:MAG: histidine kinase [Ferruginibacter sp.]
MKLPKLFVSLVLSVMIMHGNTEAQDFSENNFTLYTKQDGLSHNVITSIAQDSIGFIWASTVSGLNRFNGSNFIQFHSSSDSLSIPQEHLDVLTWLDDRRLAVTSAEGLHIIDTRTGETRNLFVPYIEKRYQYKFNTIMTAKGNAVGDIFLLTRSGFYHFDKDYKLVFRFDYYTKQEVSATGFAFGRKMLWLDDHRFIIFSSVGVYFYNIKTKRFKLMEPADAPILAPFLGYPKSDYLFLQPKPGTFLVLYSESDSVAYINTIENKTIISHFPFQKNRQEFDYRSNLFAVNDSTLYITSNTAGFYQVYLNPMSGQTLFNTKKYFSSYYCRGLLEDKDHILWIATNKGLLRQDTREIRLRQGVIPTILQDSFPNIVIDDIYGTKDSLYVATRGNGGLLVFNKHNLQFARQVSFKKYRQSADNIYCVAPAGDHDLLIGPSGPLVKMDLQNNRKTEMVLERFNTMGGWIADMCTDTDHNVWVASENIYKYDVAANKFSIELSDQDVMEKIQTVAKIKVDNTGNIWVAGHGLVRYNTTTKRIDRVVDSFPFSKIPDLQVNAFTVDQQNNLWINSNNNGLLCYNIEKQTFRHFTSADGLPDNNIAAMIVIRGKLWMAGFSGIACLDLRTFKISTFGKEDGFPDLPIAISSKFFYDSSINKIYLGLTNTIVAFDPGIIFQRSKAPHLFIENIITGDQKKVNFPGNEFTTSWQNNEITITIGSINFFTSNGQRFAYRLIKDDSTAWQQLGAQNTFSISNLSPGHHRIQVKLFSLSNRWPEQIKEIDIIVAPPFWRATWFIVLSLVILLISAYALLKWRTGLIRKKERAKTHIQELIAEEYKSQFELEQISHFFSSSLAGKKNVDEVLWDVAKNLIGRMNYADCMIYLWNDDKTKMIQKAAYGPKGDPVAINSTQFDVSPGQGVVGQVMQTKEPLLIPDTRWDRRYRVDDIRRLSELCVPILHNNELIGVIDSEHPDENHFKERDVKILTTIATLVGNKIMQIESEKSLEIKQQEIAFMNQQLAEAQLSALQTQMNPHFIFNSLNSIKGMILANEQQKASRYLSKFAQMIRITLNQSKEIFTTMYENIEHLENYLLMEKLRFDDSFTFQIVVDEQIDKEETLMPTLMIQPLAENAIWHGLMLKEGHKKLLIRFWRQDEMIACSIEDNGIGIRRAQELKKQNNPGHQSVGLSNLRNRIKIMNEKYDMGCTLDITDLHDINKDKTGTCAVLRFNIINNKPFL